MDVTTLSGMNPKLRHKLLTTIQTTPTTTTTTSEILTPDDDLDYANVVVVEEIEQVVVELSHEMQDHMGQIMNEGEEEIEQELQEQLVDIKPSIVTVTPADLLAPTFPCPHCPRMFNRRNMVTRHINEIHKVALPFKCDLCDKTFSVIPSLQKHLMNHHNIDPEPYSCPTCSDTFTLQSLLEAHNCPARPKPTPPSKKPTTTALTKKPTKKPPKKSTPPPPPLHSCKICQRDFRTKSTLKRHINSHFKCGYCRKSVSSAENLAKHLRTHEEDVEDEEKDFICGQCGKKYYVEENFKIHRVWHREESVKKYGCAGCDQRWKSEEKFTRHLEKCLGKQWECEKCGAVFGGSGKKGGKKAWERHLAGGGCDLREKVGVVKEELRDDLGEKMKVEEFGDGEKAEIIQSEVMTALEENV